MTLKLTLAALSGNFNQAMRTVYKQQSEAAKAAVREVGDIAYKEGRQQVEAGMGGRWGQAFRQKFYDDAPLTNAMLMYSKIRYSNAFEKGLTIRGKPLMWLPTDAVPLKRGRSMTPQQFMQQIGPLIFAKGPKPMLIGYVNITKKGRVRGIMSKVKRLGQLKPTVMFVGVPQVHDPKKLDIASVADRARQRLKDVYLRKFNEARGNG